MLGEKNALRQKMHDLRAGLFPEHKKAIDDRIAAHILCSPVFLNASTIFCYCSTEKEISTTYIMQAAFQQNKTVCVPRCSNNGYMQAYKIDSFNQLRHGKFGIMEPINECALVTPELISLCIIPCLAADKNGHRLGYGGGYYDRYLLHTSAVRMVLCAQNRLLKQLPTETHDLKCDLIVTEEQVIWVHEK